MLSFTHYLIASPLPELDLLLGMHSVKNTIFTLKEVNVVGKAEVTRLYGHYNDETYKGTLRWRWDKKNS